MADPNQTYDIAIVGGGPVGLFLGLCLHQAGLSSIVLEKRSETVSHSRSLGVHPVSLELFDKLEMAEPFIQNGIKIKKGIAYSDRGKIGSIHFERHSTSSYPFILSIPQFKTEKLLEEHLMKRSPGTLERNANVVELKETDTGVALSYRKNGQLNQVKARYVVGCDGKESFVRDAAGISFTGSAYNDTYIMGDFTDNTIFESDAVIFLTGGGLVESFPLPGKMRRWVVKTDSYISDPSRNDLERLVAQRIGHDLGEEEHVMLSSFGVQRLLSHSMAEGRIALAGDAAHIVSPIGGQGMNLGWLDAWDLCSVFQEISNDGNRSRELLSGYSNRRTRIAEKAIRRAEFNMKLGRKSKVGIAKRILVWTLLNTPLKKYMARFFTMQNLQ